MDKVYIVEYVECTIEGMSSIENTAFSNYRDVSQHLLDLGYKVEPNWKLNYQNQEWSYDLRFEIEDEFGEFWVGNIHELDLR